jgi:hypothetical protein
MLPGSVRSTMKHQLAAHRSDCQDRLHYAMVDAMDLWLSACPTVFLCYGVLGDQTEHHPSLQVAVDG